MSKDYIKPDKVISPKAHWQLIDVLEPASKENIAVAIGRWDGEICLGLRWNGHADNIIGNPQSRGLPTWFILTEPYTKMILGGIEKPGNKEKIQMARTLLKQN
jgi:hypothetical protein